MQLLRLQARKLLNRSADELFMKLTGKFILVFDDGEMTVDWRSTVFSRLFWRYHEEYPTLPLQQRHHLESVLNGGPLTSSSHAKLIQNIYWDVYYHELNKRGGEAAFQTLYPDQGLIDMEVALRDRLNYLAFGVTNAFYNFIVGNLGADITTLTIDDFVEIIKHPKIQKMKAALESTWKSSDDGQQFVRNFILTEPGMGHNNLMRSARAGLIKVPQAVQCIGPRGTVTNVNSEIFREPILSGFAEGLRDIGDFAKETCSAGKSMMMSKADLQDSEYFSRKLQFMTTYVRTVHHGDCGSKRYLYMNVRERDLKLILGKYYLDDDDGKLKVVTKHDRHLIGRSLRIRDSINCNHPDPNGVCATCFGTMWRALPWGSNIGYLAAAYLMQILSQSILSVKHSDNGSGAAPIELTKQSKTYFKVSEDQNSYILRPEWKGKIKSITIARSAAPHLFDIADTNVNEINITNISEISDIELELDDGTFTETVPVKVHSGGRDASMTHDFLNHILSVGWKTNQKDNYVIALENWDFDKPILSMPLKHYNMSEHNQYALIE